MDKKANLMAEKWLKRPNMDFYQMKTNLIAHVPNICLPIRSVKAWLETFGQKGQSNGQKVTEKAK